MSKEWQRLRQGMQLSYLASFFKKGLLILAPQKNGPSASLAVVLSISFVAPEHQQFSDCPFVEKKIDQKRDICNGSPEEIAD
jgi:hypothetical protein